MAIDVRNRYDVLVGVAEHMKEVIRLLGEDVEREGLAETPDRVARAYYDELLSGYRENPEDVFKVFEPDGYDGLVLVRDIPVVSLCEHHVLPWYGVAHVAYIPEDKIIGLSKIGRLVDIFAKRLQVQERFTKQVADTLYDGLQPKGVMVVVEAAHTCMIIRGVQKAGSKTVTSAVRGVFFTVPSARHELLALLGKPQ